jgi:hypothetical protein
MNAQDEDRDALAIEHALRTLQVAFQNRNADALEEVMPPMRTGPTRSEPLGRAATPSWPISGAYSRTSAFAPDGSSVRRRYRFEVALPSVAEVCVDELARAFGVSRGPLDFVSATVTEGKAAAARHLERFPLMPIARYGSLRRVCRAVRRQFHEPQPH